MRDYDDPIGRSNSFNPIKIGVIGALFIAAVVALTLVYNSYSDTNEGLKRQVLEKEKKITLLEDENDALKQKVEELRSESSDTSEKLRKQLQQRESQILSTRREREQDSREAQNKLSELADQHRAAESQIGALRKQIDDEKKSTQKLQDQVTKLQSELKKSQSDADKYARNYNELQKKLAAIEEGDQAAEDAIVQQLADARRQLRQEQETRRRLEQELDQLRTQVGTSDPQ